MCSGRVAPEMVLRAFRSGADGVLVLGCHIGDCHYSTGNHRTAKRIPLLRRLLDHVGIDPQRLRLDWVSSAEAPKFTQVTSEFVETVRRLGPLSVGDGQR
jgi:F420-non-reducing hydrogenase iron-sulfur subunit